MAFGRLMQFKLNLTNLDEDVLFYILAMSLIQYNMIHFQLTTNDWATKSFISFRFIER